MNESHVKNIGAIILAAGKGKRMASSMPKVMHQLAHQPLIAHVLSAAVPLLVMVLESPNTRTPTALPPRGPQQLAWYANLLIAGDPP